MEMGKRRLDDDPMSGNWSFGSNNRLCSQTRKISIGVMADSSAKMKSQNGRGVVADLKTSENVNMAKDYPTESNYEGKEVVSPDSGTQNKAPCQELSPTVHTKSSYQNISYSEANGPKKKVSSFPSTTNVTLKPSGSKRAGEMEPGSYFANQMLNLQAKNASEVKSKNNTYQTEKGSSYETPQKEVEPKKGIAEQGTSVRGNSGPVTLRMKVQELLETVYSPSKKQPNSESFKCANNSKPKSTTIGNDNLHTRKTNSGSVDKIMRPLTRSLTGKKPRGQKSTPRKQTPLYQSNQAQFEENAFSFVETWSKRPTPDSNNGFKSFKRKESEISGTRVQATDGKKTKAAAAINVSLFENTKQDSEKVQPNTTAKKIYQHQFGGNNGSVSYNNVDVATDGKKTKAAAINVSLFENRTRDSEEVKQNTEVKEKKHPQFKGNDGSGSYNNVDVDSFAKDSLKVDPTFDLKTAYNMSSPISLFQINKEDIDVDTPFENSFRTKQARSSTSKGFYTKNISMDLQESPVIKPDREENKYFRSPSKLVESESSESEDDSPITVAVISEKLERNKSCVSPYQDEDSESSEDDSPVKVPIISEKLGGNKSCISPYQDEDSESSEDDSPIKGDVDCEKFDDSSEQDGFASAVKLFALALERVQSKIQSTTSKQSAAILLSVSKNIQSQMQNAESRIQNEVGKLTNLGKSKRMHTENQYQEQQEQLKHIYVKFKEEVDQHLEKCKNTLEGLEAHQIQVSRMVEKQRLSQKKFLMQTEEVIEKQLNDAQKRLADVHRIAKEKMFRLKYGIAECLKEGLLT